ERHVAAARASMPTLEAKERAWTLAVQDESLPNAVQSAVIGGFWQAEQRDLLAPFVDRYFASIDDVWRDRTAEMAQNVVVGLYPGLVVDRSVVERTDSYLQGADVPAALQRLLLEGRDSVVRALRARERDAAAG
ncbi:MAG: aminopeptidase, partial [Frankiales bacterium]|nr:aminopeptidase [Frankiales bacterium]